jgi:iron complex transport system permease protein
VSDTLDTPVAGPPLTRPRVRATTLSAGWLATGVLALLVAIAVGVTVGPASLAPAQVGLALLDGLPGVAVDAGLSSTQADILWKIRLPRVVLGAVVGGALALSGAAYQGVFRNALADPYLLGVAAGAGLGATLAIVAGLSGAVIALPMAAFVGAVAAVGATYLLGRSVGTARSSSAIILAGVAVASFLTAVQTFVQQQNAETLREVYSWILGRLATAGWGEVLLVLPYVTVAAIVMLLHRRLLDVLAVGEAEARTLGVNADRVRLLVVLAATLATAAAVAVSGLIGFVGIIVPHTVRLLAGGSHRALLPLSLLLGAAFLVIADVLARSVVAPGELPIGVVTAFFGAPFFTLVLRTSRRSLL